MEYYFTFGPAHKTKSGIPMKDYWVRVIGNGQQDAMEKFTRGFTEKFMSGADKYSMIYGTMPSDKKMFPKGEFALIDTDLWVKMKE